MLHQHSSRRGLRQASPSNALYIYDYYDNVPLDPPVLRSPGVCTTKIGQRHVAASTGVTGVGSFSSGNYYNGTQQIYPSPRVPSTSLTLGLATGVALTGTVLLVLLAALVWLLYHRRMVNQQYRAVPTAAVPPPPTNEATAAGTSINDSAPNTGGSNNPLFSTQTASSQADDLFGKSLLDDDGRHIRDGQPPGPRIPLTSEEEPVIDLRRRMQPTIRKPMM